MRGAGERPQLREVAAGHHGVDRRLRARPGRPRCHVVFRRQMGNEQIALQQLRLRLQQVWVVLPMERAGEEQLARSDENRDRHAVHVERKPDHGVG